MLYDYEPNNPDSNANGTPDGSEDADADGLYNFQEYASGSDPNVADTGGDSESSSSTSKRFSIEVGDQSVSLSEYWKLRIGNKVYDPKACGKTWNGYDDFEAGYTYDINLDWVAGENDIDWTVNVKPQTDDFVYAIFEKPKEGTELEGTLFGTHLSPEKGSDNTAQLWIPKLDAEIASDVVWATSRYDYDGLFDGNLVPITVNLSKNIEDVGTNLEDVIIQLDYDNTSMNIWAKSTSSNGKNEAKLIVPGQGLALSEILKYKENGSANETQGSDEVFTLYVEGVWNLIPPSKDPIPINITAQINGSLWSGSLTDSVKVKVKAVVVDIDVDSDNNSSLSSQGAPAGYPYSLKEESLEDKWPKIIAVGAGTEDEPLIRVVLKIPEIADYSPNEFVYTLHYNDSAQYNDSAIILHSSYGSRIIRCGGPLNDGYALDADEVKNLFSNDSCDEGYTLFIEGVELGTYDITFKATKISGENQGMVISDTVKVVVALDLDTDSDNDGTVEDTQNQCGYPFAEDLVEDNGVDSGKVIVKGGDLAEIRVVCSAGLGSKYPGYTLKLTADPGLNVWKDSSKTIHPFEVDGDPAPLFNDTLSEVYTCSTSFLSGTFYVEGSDGGKRQIKLEYCDPNGTVLARDTVVFLVLDTDIYVDLDIDSDNSQLFGSDGIDHSSQEEFLEDHPYASGKLIPLYTEESILTKIEIKVSNSLPDSTPITFSFPTISVPSTATGRVRIWKNNDRSNPIYPDQVYHLSDFDKENGVFVLYVEGYMENPNTTTKEDVMNNTKPSTHIKVKLYYDGNVNGSYMSDTVKFMVVNHDSFYYKLASRPALLSAYISESVYTPENNLNFCYAIQTENELNGLFLSPATRSALNGNVTWSGFSVRLYREYLTGKYIVAFAGTKPTSLGDIMTDVEQAFGVDGVFQYSWAKTIGQALKDSSLNSDNTYIAGHSLGGGLASLASLVSGFHAYTFNAAGVHPDSLIDENGDSIDVSGANGLIDAYRVDYDILSLSQSLLGWVIPEAVGRPIMIESSYSEAEFNMPIYHLYIAIMCHLNPQVQYGMEHLYGVLHSSQN